MKLRCAEYVEKTVAPQLQATEIDWSAARLTIDPADSQTLNFEYPRALGDDSYGGGAYVSAKIRLEFGARGELWPAEAGRVVSYAAQEFPALFNDPTTRVWVLSPRRTFWEKATILHAIASSGHLLGGDRQSRHYSDLAQMAKSDFGRAAIADTELLLDVADHKATFFPWKSASYDSAKPGSLKLVPPASVIPLLRRDYEGMREMFMAEPLGFDALMEAIAALEQDINRQEP